LKFGKYFPATRELFPKLGRRIPKPGKWIGDAGKATGNVGKRASLFIFWKIGKAAGNFHACPAPKRVGKKIAKPRRRKTIKPTTNKNKKGKNIMIVKPSISFISNDSDALLVTDTQTILTSMTGNASFPTPDPTLAAVTTALNDFTIALANAADGGITLTSIKNDKRADLAALLRDLANYVQVACNADLTILLSSGFPIQKPQRNPIGVLPAPWNLMISLGSHSGQLNAVVPPVFGASIYNWRLTASNAPTVVVQSAQTTGGRTTFTGLTPGVVYVAQVNVVGAAGPSDWSQPASQMAV
jgi:hypothetical protein